MTDTRAGVDISNLQDQPSAYRTAAWYEAAEFVIAQAIPRPVPPGLTTSQLVAAQSDGKAVGIYTWLWHDPSWRLGDQSVEGDQLARLACVDDSISLDMRPWLDVEDDQSTNWSASGVLTRRDDVLRALETLNDWAAKRGGIIAGGYTSVYFINRLLGGWWPSGVPLWLADYNQPAGSVLDGRVVGHQWTSKPIDQDVFLESEFIVTTDPTPSPDPAPPDCSGLISSLGYIAGDALAPVVAQKTKGTKAMQALIAAIQHEADAHGINHA